MGDGFPTDVDFLSDDTGDDGVVRRARVKIPAPEEAAPPAPAPMNADTLAAALLPKLHGLVDTRVAAQLANQQGRGDHLTRADIPGLAHGIAGLVAGQIEIEASRRSAAQLVRWGGIVMGMTAILLAGFAQIGIAIGYALATDNLAGLQDAYGRLFFTIGKVLTYMPQSWLAVPLTLGLAWIAFWGLIRLPGRLLDAVAKAMIKR